MPKADLEAHVRETAETIAANAPLAGRGTKFILQQGQHQQSEDGRRNQSADHGAGHRVVEQSSEGGTGDRQRHKADDRRRGRRITCRRRHRGARPEETVGDTVSGNDTTRETAMSPIRIFLAAIMVATLSLGANAIRVDVTPTKVVVKKTFRPWPARR